MAAVLSESVLDQNGPNDNFGQNDLFSEPDFGIHEAKMVHFGPIWPRRSILVHLGPPTVLCPKDPTVLKILRRNYAVVKFTMRSKFTIAQRFAMATPPRADTIFRGFAGIFPQRRVQGVVNLGGIVKTLRRSNSLSRSIFSTVGSFGWPFLIRMKAHRLRSERPFTGVSGPSGAKIAKKSQKESFWGSAKKSPKIPEKVKNDLKKSNFGVFLTFLGIFGDFFADPQKDSF